MKHYNVRNELIETGHNGRREQKCKKEKKKKTHRIQRWTQAEIME